MCMCVTGVPMCGCVCVGLCLLQLCMSVFLLCVSGACVCVSVQARMRECCFPKLDLFVSHLLMNNSSHESTGCGGLL